MVSMCAHSRYAHAYSYYYNIYVTRYEKRDRSGYYIDSLFLVWIVSAIIVESNGASFVKKEAS